MTKEDSIIEKQGIVEDLLPGSKFRVKLEDEDQAIICTISGKIRKNYIKIQRGDIVKVSISLYDTSQGRITYRSKESSLNK